MAWGTNGIGALGVLALVQLGAGCGSTNDPSTTPGTGGTGGTTGSCSQQLVITDDTNYSFTSTLTVESTVVKDATDLLFDWSNVTRDFFGREMNPVTDIDMVLVSLWGMTEADLATNLNRDHLPRGQMDSAITVFPSELDRSDGSPTTSAHLTEFNSFRNEIPPDFLWARFDTSTPNYAFPPASFTFLMMIATGETPGRNSRMLGYFRLDPNATNTTIALHDGSTVLDYQVNLANVHRFPVPPATPALTVDWSQMTRNALGNEYDRTQITEAVVAHYAAHTLEDIQAEPLLLIDGAIHADGWWSAEVTQGTSVDLATFTDAAGSPFPGVDAVGTWFVGLYCTTVDCNNPAPWSVTVLTPCSAL